MTGRVLSSDDSALVSATVQVKNTSIITQTNETGRFSIRGPQNAVLVVRFMGFATKEVSMGTRTNITVKLEPLPFGLADVVVVGYGQQRKPTVTGAVGVITSKELTQTPVANISNMLIGRTSGISGVQNGGEPGQNATTIRIRGIATLNGADPLIVIDGIQQPAEQPYIVLNAMDANEVESISILKDASATAVYGIRGANGVVIITTKRGMASRPQFSFSVNEGFTKANSIFETVNSYDFAVLRNEAIRNAQSSGNRSFDALYFSDAELWKFQNNRDYTPEEVGAMLITNEQKQALLNSPALYYTDNDYYKEQFGGTGRQRQYNLNVSGGSARVKYFTSLGIFNQNGILSNTEYGGANTNPEYTRYNFRSNFDIDIIKNFKLSFNLGGQSSVNKIIGTSSSPNFGDRYQAIIQSILENSPFVGPGIVDGRLITGYIGEAGSFTNPLGNKSGSGASPLAALLTGGSRRVNTTTLSSVLTLRHTMSYLTPGLESHVRLAYDDSYVKGFTQTNSIPTYSAMRDPSDPARIIYVGGIVNPTTAADNQQNSTWRKLYVEAAVNYSRRFGDHNVSALILGNAQRYTANGQAFNTPSGLMGLVARTSYDFKERYLIEFSSGINGTENFAKGKRFGYFPAISGGWIISNEPFFRKNDVLSFVKIRGSYGEVGNDQIGGRRYLFLPNTWGSAGGYNFGNSNGTSVNPGVGGAIEGALGNPEVTWERARKTNVSVDLNFLGDRLTLVGSWFQEKRNNILVTSGVIPGTFGVNQSNTAPLNLGKVSNKGFEAEGGWNDKIGAWGYSIRGNFSFAKNKIDYRAEAPFPYEWMNETGYAIGQYKGLLTDGFYNTQEELNNRPFNSFGNQARLGDLKFRDVTGDGTINEQDLVPVGYSNLPQINYNLNVGFSYKGFDISALFIGTARGSFPQYDYIMSTPFAQNRGAVLQYMFDGRWTPEKVANGEPISYPAISMSGGQSNNVRLSDFWLKKNDFQRLKNLELGYSFQQVKFLRSAGIKALRVYANGNNLVTWGSDLIDGIDPEQADTGKNRSGYLFPLTRTYNFGVNVQF
ncbi:SusC/RagA family TonB-linked outer membrane protein [Arcticibacter tournemirensis]|nr:TonB-dependent receptor [Arcticibacter tournemirensis]